MSKTATAPVICQVCKKPKSPHSRMIAGLIRPSLLEFIKKKSPHLDSKSFICLDDFGEFRKEIRHLHEKIDHLLRRQYNRLFEIQQIQIELLVQSLAFRRRFGLL